MARFQSVLPRDIGTKGGFAESELSGFRGYFWFSRKFIGLISSYNTASGGTFLDAL
jgi:hypothetical protein